MLSLKRRCDPSMYHWIMALVCSLSLCQRSSTVVSAAIRTAPHNGRALYLDAQTRIVGGNGVPAQAYPFFALTVGTTLCGASLIWSGVISTSCVISCEVCRPTMTRTSPCWRKGAARSSRATLLKALCGTLAARSSARSSAARASCGNATQIIARNVKITDTWKRRIEDFMMDSAYKTPPLEGIGIYTFRLPPLRAARGRVGESEARGRVECRTIPPILRPPRILSSLSPSQAGEGM